MGGIKDNIGVLFPGGLGAAPEAPNITFANISTLPPAPAGLKYSWLTDPDELGRDDARVPIFTYAGHLYTGTWRDVTRERGLHSAQSLLMRTTTRRCTSLLGTFIGAKPSAW